MNLFIRLSNQIKEKIIYWLLNKNPILENRLFLKLNKLIGNKKLVLNVDPNWIRNSYAFNIPTQKFFDETYSGSGRLLNEFSDGYKVGYLEEIFFHVGSIEHWCEENCIDQWGIANNELEYIFYFQNSIDAMAFKLRWL